MAHRASITAAFGDGAPPLRVGFSRAFSPVTSVDLRWLRAVWAWMIVVPSGAGVFAADVVRASPTNPPQSPSRRVVQAGGVDRGPADVRPCGHVHPVGGHRCNGQCQGAGCPAHCPVRPGSFGFYGTQWRAWPTEGGVTTASYTDATPVSPPKSEVPGVNEESLRQAPAEEAEAARSAAENAGEAAMEDRAEERPREPAPLPVDVRPEAANDGAGRKPGAGGRQPEAVQPLEPAKEEAVPETPDVKEPAVPAPPAAEDENRKKNDDDNLFDEARRGLRRQEILAVLQRRAARQVAGRCDAAVAAGAIDGVRLASHPDPVVGRTAAEETAPVVPGSPSKHDAEQGAVSPAPNPASRGLRSGNVNGLRNPLRGSP